MKEIRNLTCIRCPMGCQLTVTLQDGAVQSVTGNTCPRGAEYGRNEVTHPVRTVTSTVRVEGGERPVVAVKTKTEVPKEKIFDVMQALNGLYVKAPVEIGDVLLEDIAGTGSSLVATAEDAAC